MSLSAALLAAIREEARPGIWSLGVNLSRQGAVALESRAGDELVFRVRAPGRKVPWTAVLYPKDAAWECDCPSKVDPCEHAVAAALSLQQADAAGGEVKSAEAAWSRVVYRFARTEGGLALRRTVAAPDGTEAPLETSLEAFLANPAQASRTKVEQADLIADRLLERAHRGALPPDRLDRLLTALTASRTVLLDGEPVAVSAEVVFPRALVEDAEGGAFRVTVDKDPRVAEVVSPGVARCGDALCRLGETSVTGPWLHLLPSVRTWPAEKLGELTGQVLPQMAQRFVVEVRSPRVPRIDPTLAPRIQLELNAVEGGLSVLPLLVYGAPPHVRIDAGRMVWLRGAVPVRDEAAEAREVQGLREQLDLVPGRRATFQGPDQARFVEKLRRYRGTVTGEGARLLGEQRRLLPVLQARAPGDRAVPEVSFDLEFQVEGGGGAHAAAGDVLRAWQEGLGLVPLAGGGWAELPRDFLEKHGALVAELLDARDASGKVANHALPRLAELHDVLGLSRPEQLERLRPLVETFEGLGPPELPSDLQATLRPYQAQGVAWLQLLAKGGLGGVLADDMGLGKTLQAACVLARGSLVVCPTSVLPNWQAELARFRPGLKVCVFHGPSRALDETADVTLTTWAILRLDEDALCARRWTAAVLDEAQAIKNPDSQTARAAFRLQADFRLALSGTPVENRLEELWSLMRFTNPGLLGTRTDFQDRVAQPIADGRPDAALALRRKLKPYVLRRLKRDVAPDLPPRSESVLYVQLEERERATYDAVLAATRADVAAALSGGGGVLAALEALLRLRQAACHPGLLPGQQAKGSSKVRALVESLGTAAADGHRALVFSQWTSLLDLIEPELHAAGLGFVRLDGSTADRAAVTARFQAEDGPPVMLVSLKAGGTGLNLTAADHVYLVDPWWNPAAEAQAADRAHRIGQTRPVFVHRLVAQGTVEERILGLQERKRALFEAALGDAGAAVALTKDDLLELLA